MHSDSVERLGESGPLAVRDGVEVVITCIVLFGACNQTQQSERTAERVCGPLAVRDGVEGLIACIVLESCNRNGSSGLGQAVSLA